MCSFNIEFTLFSQSKRVICSIVWGVPRVGVFDYMHRLLNVLRFEEHRQKHRRRWVQFLAGSKFDFFEPLPQKK